MFGDGFTYRLQALQLLDAILAFHDPVRPLDLQHAIQRLGVAQAVDRVILERGAQWHVVDALRQRDQVLGVAWLAGAALEPAAGMLPEFVGAEEHPQKAHQPDQVVAHPAAGAHQIPDIEETFAKLKQRALALAWRGFFDEGLLFQPTELGGHAVDAPAETLGKLSGADRVPVVGDGVHQLLGLLRQFLETRLVEWRDAIEQTLQIAAHVAALQALGEDAIQQHGGARIATGEGMQGGDARRVPFQQFDDAGGLVDLGQADQGVVHLAQAETLEFGDLKEIVEGRAIVVAGLDGAGAGADDQQAGFGLQGFAQRPMRFPQPVEHQVDVVDQQQQAFPAGGLVEQGLQRLVRHAARQVANQPVQAFGLSALAA